METSPAGTKIQSSSNEHQTTVETTHDEAMPMETNQAKNYVQNNYPFLPTETDNRSQPPTDNELTEDTYYIERMLKHHTKHGRREFLIKWMDFPSNQNTWEPEENIPNKQLIKEYFDQKNKNKRVVAHIDINHNQPAIQAIDQANVKFNSHATLTAHSKPRTSNLKTIYGFSCRPLFVHSLWWTIVFSLVVSVTAINIGPLYDCTQVTPVGVYRYPVIRRCDHDMHSINSSMQTFVAGVYAYHPYLTKFKIYHCQAEEVTLVCKTNFINSKARTHKTSVLPVTAGQCFSAMNTKVLVYGALLENPPGVWRTKTTDHYTCSWMKTKYTSYKHFRMTTYEASILGTEAKITQFLTKTRCYYMLRRCVPIELPKSQIVWTNADHDQTTMRLLGRFKVDRIGDFLLMRALKIGGSVQITSQAGHVINQSIKMYFTYDILYM